MTTPAIKGFFGEHRFLSNFGEGAAWYDDVRYPTAEHAYQAAKFDDLDYREVIRGARTPHKAKRLGQTRDIPVREGWDEGLAYIAMSEVVTSKFSEVTMAEMLLATGEAYLEETNDWGDTRWGVSGGVGSNWLGLILMTVRANLREDGWR